MNPNSKKLLRCGQYLVIFLAVFLVLFPSSLMAADEEHETEGVRVTSRERPYGEGKEDISVLQERAGYGPECFAVDRNGNIYICDTVNRRIQVYNSEFEYLSTLRLQKGARPDEVVPEDMLIDDRGNIFVYSGGSLKQYDMSGNLIASVSSEDPRIGSAGPEPLRIVEEKIYLFSCNMSGVCGDVLIADISGGVMKRLRQEEGPLNNSYIGSDGKIYKGYLKGFRVMMSLIEEDGSEKKLKFPHLQDIYSVIVLGEDEGGNFYVRTLRNVNKKAVGEIHRFSPEGDLLTTFRQPEIEGKFWSARKYVLTPKGTVYYYPRTFEKAMVHTYEFGGN